MLNPELWDEELCQVLISNNLDRSLPLLWSPLLIPRAYGKYFVYNKYQMRHGVQYYPWVPW